MTCFIPHAESPLDPHFKYSNILTQFFSFHSGFHLLSSHASHLGWKTRESLQLEDIQSYTAKTWKKPSQNRSFFQACWPFKTNKERKTIEKSSSQLVPFGVFASPRWVISPSRFFDAKQQNHHNIQRSSSTLTGPTFRKFPGKGPENLLAKLHRNFQAIFEGRFPLLNQNLGWPRGRVFICHSQKCFILHSPHWISGMVQCGIVYSS